MSALDSLNAARAAYDRLHWQQQLFDVGSSYREHGFVSPTADSDPGTAQRPPTLARVDDGTTEWPTGSTPHSPHPAGVGDGKPVGHDTFNAGRAHDLSRLRALPDWR